MNHQRIGDMNGKWAALLKMGLVVLPLVLGSAIALGVWTVRTVSAHDARLASFEATRFTDRDGAELRSEWRESVATLSADMRAMSARLGEIASDVKAIRSKP